MEQTPALAGKSGPLRKAVGLSLQGGAVGFAVGAFPSLFHRGHVLADILHSDAIALSLAVASFLMFICLVMLGVQRRAIAGVSPRPFFCAMFAGLFITGFAIICWFTVRDHRLAVDLTSRGVPAQARLIRTFTESCGKSGCSTGIDYEFVPKNGSQPARGSANEGNVRHGASPAYAYAVSTGTVPILYDPADPRRSMVYWGDEIARKASPGRLTQDLGFFGGLLLLLVLMIALPLWRIMNALVTDTKTQAARRPNTPLYATAGG